MGNGLHPLAQQTIIDPGGVVTHRHPNFQVIIAVL
jgi:hypothetical protein